MDILKNIISAKEINSMINHSVSIKAALKIATVIISTLAVFYQDIIILFNGALYNQETSYILLIPFIILFLIYRKRKVIRASFYFKSSNFLKIIRINEIVGILLIIISFLIYWYGSYTFNTLEYHFLALPVFATGCILFLFNFQTVKSLLFPLLFLLLLIPPPATILANFGASLSLTSSNIAYGLTSILGLPYELGMYSGTPTFILTQQDGTTINFVVDIACSGMYSQLGFIVFALFTTYLIRDKIWKKAVFLFLGLPLIYLLNIFRISIILLIGYYFSVSLALEIFHLLGGWILIFIGTFALLLISEKIFKISIFSKNSEECPECQSMVNSNEEFCSKCYRIKKMTIGKITKKDFAKIFSLVITVILILSIQAPVFALTEGPAEIALQTPKGEEVQTTILPNIPGYSLNFMYEDTYFEEIAGQDSSLMFAYTSNNLENNTIWVGIEIASSKDQLHAWENCLITWPTTHGSQQRVDQIELEDVKLTENPPITGRFFFFKWRDSNITDSVLYWYETSTFKLNSTSGQKHIKISLIVRANSPDEVESIQKTKDELLIFAEAIVNYWEPIKTWSDVALTISQNGSSLIVITLVALILIIILEKYQQNKTKKLNYEVYKKISKEKKDVLNAVFLAEQFPSTLNILNKYKEITRNTISSSKLLEELEKFEKSNLVTKIMINKFDEPFLGWKYNYSQYR